MRIGSIQKKQCYPCAEMPEQPIHLKRVPLPANQLQLEKGRMLDDPSVIMRQRIPKHMRRSADHERQRNDEPALVGLPAGWQQHSTVRLRQKAHQRLSKG